MRVPLQIDSGIFAKVQISTTNRDRARTSRELYAQTRLNVTESSFNQTPTQESGQELAPKT